MQHCNARQRNRSDIAIINANRPQRRARAPLSRRGGEWAALAAPASKSRAPLASGPLPGWALQQRSGAASDPRALRCYPSPSYASPRFSCVPYASTISELLPTARVGPAALASMRLQGFKLCCRLLRRCAIFFAAAPVLLTGPPCCALISRRCYHPPPSPASRGICFSSSARCARAALLTVEHRQA